MATLTFVGLMPLAVSLTLPSSLRIFRPLREPNNRSKPMNLILFSVSFGKKCCSTKAVLAVFDSGITVSPLPYYPDHPAIRFWQTDSHAESLVFPPLDHKSLRHVAWVRVSNELPQDLP